MHTRVRLGVLAILTACSAAPRAADDTPSAVAPTDSAAGKGAAADTGSGSATAGRSELAGTAWRLVKIQSMADSTFTPSDPSRYTINFGADGRASLRVDCNRGSATWTSEASGHLIFGPAAMTKVMCPPESLYNRVMRDLPYVRTYVLRNGNLHLATMADGAIYELEPIP